MLNYKNKFLKIVFTLLFAFFSSQSALAMESAPPVDKKYYAKVVFLGYIGAGKTVLYELLTGQLQTLKFKEHSTNINASEVEYDVDGKKVRVFFFDTSAEPRHKEVMDSFCHNADIIFAVVNAKDLINESNNKTYRPAGQRYFEKLLGRLHRIAPKSRVILVLTQKKCIKNSEHDDSAFLQNVAEDYLNTIDKAFEKNNNNDSDSDSDSDDEKYNSAHKNGKYVNIDARYDLTLHEKSLNKDKTFNHRSNLEDLITESLRKYGVENLPDNSKGFGAKILEHTIYKQNTYIWGLIEGKKEKVNTKYSLNYNNNKISSQSTVVTEKCSIF